MGNDYESRWSFVMMRGLYGVVGSMRLKPSRIHFQLLLPAFLGLAIANLAHISSFAQTAPAAKQALTLRADVQQANTITGVVTARGNVQMNYPARQIQATSAQAQYFSRERRIVLSGNVYVLQQGNSLRADTVTYLIDEERFVALPVTSQQVESIILIQDSKPSPSPSPN
jgi:lipopolysaccharide export system protein LptA